MSSFYLLLATSISDNSDDFNRTSKSLFCCSKQLSKLSPANKSKISSCFLYIANNFGKSSEDLKRNPIRFFLQDQSFDVRPVTLLRLLENITQEKVTVFGNKSNLAAVQPLGRFIYLFTKEKAEKIFFPSFFWAFEASLKKAYDSIPSLQEFESKAEIDELLSRLRFEKLHPIMADINIMKKSSSTTSQLHLNIDHLVNQNLLVPPAPITFNFNNKTYSGLVMGNNSGGYSFLYKPSGALVGSKIPSSYIQQVVATDDPTLSTKGRGWQSLYSHGRSLSSLRSECERNMYTIELKKITSVVTRAAIANGRVTAYTKKELELKSSPKYALLKSKYIDLKQDDHILKPESKMKAVILKPHIGNEPPKEESGENEATLGCYMTDGDGIYALTAGHVMKEATQATSILKLKNSKEKRNWKLFCQNGKLDYACLKLDEGSKKPSLLHIQGLKCDAIEKEYHYQSEDSSEDDNYNFCQELSDDEDFQSPVVEERSNSDLQDLASRHADSEGVLLELDPLAINYEAIGTESNWACPLFKVGRTTGITVGYIHGINESNVVIGSYSCLSDFSDYGDSGSLHFTYCGEHLLPLAIHCGGEHVREGVRLDVIVRDIMKQTNVELSFCAYYENFEDEKKP